MMSPAYFETHFQLEGSDGNWPSEFAIVTAYNTTGEIWSSDRNSAAETDLTAEVAAMGVWRRRITGYSPSTSHAEPGWAIELSLDDARDLGLRYKQDAIYYVTGDELWVTFCDGRRQLVRVGSFADRLHHCRARGTTA
jgi:hypothetical protein